MGKARARHTGLIAVEEREIEKRSERTEHDGSLGYCFNYNTDELKKGAVHLLSAAPDPALSFCQPERNSRDGRDGLSAALFSLSLCCNLWL